MEFGGRIDAGSKSYVRSTRIRPPTPQRPRGSPRTGCRRLSRGHIRIRERAKV
ncbi:hypothetical protein BD309DRAFT_867509 [Dichomitus squalens]|uniref:Uncharacterized protein n=1 Tax=Dichomitus squalens TaxID=114155 RepID=A0A4V2K1Z4_9APHY|nr:uncharacterized protein DICSQDRAFT_142499 [Dichomitus squalens LYAD-421 SS1]EJF66905.1 hypothetical protein DICSQDRAFT_142499 [Dichomitus squalens LYAD-421 SS1]TBU34683.1 hypothetical protein BD311DRAFT_773737 [Dichomitus squalens]TBU41843.1 hypothetical protein BD309DRAFT_867509 [Dichomitus squalens]TBU63716.1 hypothetical protein BD310DRAFT_915764 [Dichomitus squalens]